jgi:hypothetical protein
MKNSARGSRTRRTGRYEFEEENWKSMRERKVTMKIMSGWKPGGKILANGLNLSGSETRRRAEATRLRCHAGIEPGAEKLPAERKARTNREFCHRTKTGTEQKKNWERQESARADREAEWNTTQAEHEPRRQEENGSEQENMNGLAAAAKINDRKTLCSHENEKNSDVGAAHLKHKAKWRWDGRTKIKHLLHKNWIWFTS